ncbi:hypothetical protein BDZ89DRAFT_1068931 [Hymenopellis radicata]|nr:hypothetical protein BDZ89DRAFT_1068931 [Hymenopellis radicata]
MPPHKRAKVSASDDKENVAISAPLGKKNKQKNISGLIDMPLDICFELFRQTLMSRASLTVWQQARKRFYPDLPDPQDTLSEPAWISLIFENRCHACAKAIRRVIDWDLGIRLCPKCAPTSLIDVNTLNDEDRRLIGLVPISYAVTYKKFVNMAVVFRPQYEKIAARYKALETSPEKELFFALYETRTREWESTVAKEGRKWAAQQAENHDAETHAIKEQRKVEIWGLLGDEGYDDELDDDDCTDALETHWFVKQRRELTAKTWLNNRDMMLDFMDGLRVKRLKRERNATVQHRRTQSCIILQFMRQLLDHFIHESGPREGLFRRIIPNPSDWTSLPCMKAVIEIPGNDDIAWEDWDATFARIPVEIEKWTTDIHSDIFELYATAETPCKGVRDLALASYPCVCRVCSMPLFYPEVFFHLCVTASQGLTYEDWEVPEEDIVQMTSWIHTYYRRRNWDARVIRVDPDLNEIVHQVVRLLGLDPETATPGDLDDLDVYIHYIDCPYTIHHELRGHASRNAVAVHLANLKQTIPKTHSLKEKKYLFGWRKFVLVLYQNKVTETLEVGKHIELVDADSIAERPIAKIMDPEGWMCTACLYTKDERLPSNLEDVQHHIAATHGKAVDAQKEGDDYCENPCQPSEVSVTSLILCA